MPTVLVCLHGWGGSKESFTELREAMKGSDVTILAPDLPGFGNEPEPARPWTNDDYADWVERWIEVEIGKLKVESGKIFLLGHSHGGRIALKLAAQQSDISHKSQVTSNKSQVISHKSQILSHLLTHSTQHTPPNFTIDHLFLCAPAGIRHPRHFKRIIGLLLAKIGKKLLSIPGLSVLAPFGKKILYKLVRVHDYERASDIMRQTLINVSAEDLRPLLQTIDVPTEIFWGTDDRMTPYADALIMERQIPNATLHTYPGIRHAVHRERAKEIAEIIRRQIHRPTL